MSALRILVIEDEPLLGELLAEMLETMGHEVCGVERTEAEAVASAARCKPDLMIIDAWLRDGSGVSAMEKICEAGFIPHFFVSGDTSKITTSRRGAIAVQKPFRESDLASAIQRALEAALP
jgi:DNA-binding response OmpR family regulator